MTDIRLGAVVIGRNEGDRLLRCLHSLAPQIDKVVYVDSGSTDNSVQAAQHLGAKVHRLDTRRPFTAARARNAGVQLLTETWPDLTHVHFIDGDCEMRPGWVETALTFLRDPAHSQVMALAGRVRERRPEASVYHRLAEAEWNTPIGPSDACGGIAIMNLAGFRAVQGFNPNLIAGEEPELCLRLRRKGGIIWRLDAEMVWHDIDMTKFSQWWQRRKRAGFAYANGVALAGAAPDRHYVPQLRRSLTWGIAIPAVVAGATLSVPWGGVLATIWPVQVLRLRQKGHSWTEAMFLPLGALPESLGIMSFALGRLRRGPARLIEYK